MRSRRNRERVVVAIGLGLVLTTLLFVASRGHADETPAAKGAPATKPAATPAGLAEAAAEAETLPVRQEVLSRRYKRFEDTLLKLSEALRKTDPERADLLRRAISKSKESMLAPQLNELVDLLKKDQFGEALDRQQAVVTQMQTLLDLLLSEDRTKELIEERKRIEGYLKEINVIITGQKENRAATERGDPADGVQNKQKKLLDRTNDLGKKIDKDDKDKQNKSGDPKSGDPKASDPKSGDPKSGDPKSGDPKDPKSGEPKDPKSTDPKSGDPKDPKSGDPKDPKSTDPKDPKSSDPKSSDPKSGDPKSGDPKSGDPKSGDPKSGDPKSGDPKSGDPQSGDSKPQNSKSTPGRDNLEQAKREMEKALDKLKKLDRQQASNDQEEALRELQKAKDKLEEILRQLREEERLKLLAALEARFQRMLEMQLLVYDGTLKLDKIPAADRTNQHSARALQLARQEEEIVLEANKTITLLKEDGTAVAFPEAAEQMRDDMQQVVQRLERGDVAELTQSIEKDIIAALQEMIEALQKEMEKKEQQKQQGQQGQQGEKQDNDLVEQLAELKMLRSLQLRINHRTKRIGRMVKGEQAMDNDLVQQLQILGKRQSRVQQATFNLATGRNK